MVNLKKARTFERGRQLATISGWGLTDPLKLKRTYSKSRDFLFSGVLQDIRLPIVGPSKCTMKTPYYFNRKTMLCAGILDKEISPCIGDGGSPLTIQDPVTKRWVLLGLFSWSEGCAQPSKYSYYTRVTKYRRWIKSVIQ